MHIVAIGGSDAGISAALRAREVDPGVEFTVVCADAYPNFSICGIPYYVSGEVTHWRNLAHRTYADLEAAGMRLRLDTTARRIDAGARKLIVTLTSGMGSLADNTSGGSIAYRSSKAAVNMVMRSLAIDLAPRGITCVVVNPGWVQTDMGGPHARISPTESVTKLRRLIDTLRPAQSGEFFNYDGREYPW